MQPVFSMLAGMVLLGSIILRIIKFRLNLSVLAIALFVYASIGIGLLLSNHQEVREFVKYISNVYTYDITREQNIAIFLVSAFIVLIISIAAGMSDVLNLGSFLVFDPRQFLESILLGLLLVLIIAAIIYGNHLIFNSVFGTYVLFILGMALLAIVNALLGIIVVGANVAFAIVQYSKGQPIDLFSFLDVVQIDTALVSLLIMGVTTLIGSLEIVFGD